MMNQTLTTIIPAAGCGARTGFNSNKILAPLAGDTVLGQALRVLAESAGLLSAIDFDFKECVIAARKEECSLIEEVSAIEGLPFVIHLVEGGQSRQDSVQNAVEQAGTDWVMIHDAARPLLTPQLVVSVCQAARHHGNAIAALPVTDTVKCSTSAEGQKFIKSTFDRHQVWLAQTPQVFPRKLFLQALQSADQVGFKATDCASLMERLDQKIAMVPGELDNFKITYAQDLARAEYVLKERS